MSKPACRLIEQAPGEAGPEYIAELSGEGLGVGVGEAVGAIVVDVVVVEEEGVGEEVGKGLKF